VHLGLAWRNCDWPLGPPRGDAWPATEGADDNSAQLQRALRTVKTDGLAKRGLTLALTGALRQTALGPE
jgi:hypothetical protein